MFDFVAWVAVIWFSVLFCDTIFKTCMFYPYFRVLHLTGLDIKPLMIYLRITRYNRVINRMSYWNSSALKVWFNIGAITVCVIALPCLLLYLVTLYQMYKSSSLDDYDSSLLLPVIPGYNFPLSHWMYYVIVILICSVIHEFGHALAASRERISLENVGFALCAILPLAFVNVRFDQFKEISKWQQMRILCAGIWHNVILALLALFFCIFLTSPSFPLYTIGNGVSVSRVSQNSGMTHPAGFHVGDHIQGIENCNVNFTEDWKICLKEISKRSQPGLCIPENINSRSLESCHNAAGYIHFQATDPKGHFTRDVCLRGRQAIQEFTSCNQTSDCKMSLTCMFPALLSEAHKFVAIKRYEKPSVLFLGTMDELYANVQVSQFVQKYMVFPVKCADAIATFLEYMILFSSGLACLNMLPIFSLDGQFIIEILIHICFEKIIPGFNQRRYIFICISQFFLGVAICITVLTAYKIYIFTS